MRKKDSVKGGLVKDSVMGGLVNGWNGDGWTGKSQDSRENAFVAPESQDLFV